MAQLSDDCFAFGGALMTVEEARALIAERLPPVAGVADVPLAEADGRVLARDIAAPLDLPPFDNSAVDGYAVRFADLAPDGETALPVRGRVAAGATPARPAPGARRCASSPARRCRPGLDTVFMQEDVRLAGETVVLPPGLKRGANRAARRRGPSRAARRRSPPGAGSRRRTSRSSRRSGSPHVPVRAAAAGRGVLDRRRDRLARARRCGRRSSTTPTASCCWPCCAGSAARATDLGILPTSRRALSPALARRGRRRTT